MYLVLRIKMFYQPFLHGYENLLKSIRWEIFQSHLHCELRKSQKILSLQVQKVIHISLRASNLTIYYNFLFAYLVFDLCFFILFLQKTLSKQSQQTFISPFYSRKQKMPGYQNNRIYLCWSYTSIGLKEQEQWYQMETAIGSSFFYFTK